MGKWEFSLEVDRNGSEYEQQWEWELVHGSRGECESKTHYMFSPTSGLCHCVAS